MRNKLLSVIFILIITVSPTVAIADPVTNIKEPGNEDQTVAKIKSLVDTYELPTKEEVAREQIAKNIERLENERKAAEAAASLAAAAEAAKKAASVRKVVVVNSAPVDLQALYNAAGARFGVSPALLAAVHMVESGQRGDTTVSSYAGAQGPMQFIPSTFRAYAVDGDGDGVANIYDVHDAVFSAAKYLAANGAASGNVTNALLRYNHSMAYVQKVLGIARGYGYTG
jgi:membrane-bound lytic murein transglycosylase B